METRICQNCKREFVIDKEDFSFYEKIKVPPPTFCPECRLIRRLVWRNERSLYKRTCDLCDKKIVSMYDTIVSFPVYCPECWRSDKWDPEKYAQNYDFSKPFFTQWRELFSKVPRQSVWQLGNNISTEYTNFVQDTKNVYLSSSVIKNSEDIYYSNNIDNSKIIVDSYNVLDSELTYESIGSTKNYNCQYSYWSSSCIDCYFILDCMNCQNCFGCVNLRNKRYCIWNEQYSKEEYQKKIKEFDIGSYKFIQENIKAFWNFSLKSPRKYGRIISCVSSSGDELLNCKNAKSSFFCSNIENIKFAYRSLDAKDCMDVTHYGTGGAELGYEHAFGSSTGGYHVKFIISGGTGTNEIEYSDSCQSSSNLFGCINIRSKSYCILNKQYTKEEYEKLIPQIVQHMNEMPYRDSKGRIYKYGEFFPYEMSPFGYNETVLNYFYPLLKNEALDKGYNWKEKTENKYTITKKVEEIQDNIRDIDDSILNEVIECAITKKAFKITPFELQFYRRMNIPIPRLHQDERYKKRFALKNPMKLWHRKCMKEGCNNEFETPYAPERPEIVYCEECYNKEVY